MINRGSSTDRNGNPFSAAMVYAVWKKAAFLKELPGGDLMKRDEYGTLMLRDKYGETIPGGGGWEIDHIVPVALGGDDSLNNLQALQWENNRAKGDAYPDQYFDVTGRSKKYMELLQEI